MLIDFNSIVHEYGVPKGVIHIGAHLLEERGVYIKNGLIKTIWVEANRDLVGYILNNSLLLPTEMIFNYAITDIDDDSVILNLTNNGQSSSILEMDRHLVHHPSVKNVNQQIIESKRVDTLLRENNINIFDYDFVNLDIQGAELLALRGFGGLLNHVKYVYTEVNINYLYKKCALIHQIDEYLKWFGFTRKQTVLTQYEWGDALYVKA